MLLHRPVNVTKVVRTAFNGAGFPFKLQWDTFATPPNGGVVAALTTTSHIQSSAVHTVETQVLTIIAAGTSNAARDLTYDAAVDLYSWFFKLMTDQNSPITWVESLRAPMVDVQHDHNRTVTEFTVAIEATGTPT